MSSDDSQHFVICPQSLKVTGCCGLEGFTKSECKNETMRSFVFATLACIGFAVVQGYGQKGQAPIKSNAIPQHVPPKRGPSIPRPYGPPHYNPPSVPGAHGPPPGSHGVPPAGPYRPPPFGPHGPTPPGSHGPSVVENHGPPQRRAPRRPHPGPVKDDSSGYDDNNDDDYDSFEDSKPGRDESGSSDDSSSPSDDSSYDDDDRPGPIGHHVPPQSRKRPGPGPRRRPGWKHPRPGRWNHRRPRPWHDNDSSSSSPSDSYYDEDYDYHHHHHKRPCDRFTKRPPTHKTTKAPSTKSTRWTRPHTRSTRVTPTPSKNTSSYTETSPVTEPSTVVSQATPPFTEITVSPDVGKTTLSPETQRCIDTCPSTNEYNPVCGTDGQTYKNRGKLTCAINCGVDVQFLRTSGCPPPTPSPNIVTTLSTTASTPIVTVSTNTPPIGRTTPTDGFQRCMKQCHITGFFQPVCGTDLMTYLNIDRLKCAQGCGEVVHVLCEKPCAACGFGPTASTEATTLSSTTQSFGKSTQSPDIQDCIKGCPTTTEYNPVCGSDSVTYRNPGQLLCAQMCGVSVSVARLSPCSGTATTSSTTTESPMSDIQSCIKSCPLTSEYNPVCGSNGLMYKNFGQLQCAKNCGMEVELRPKSNCDNSPFTTPSATTVSVNGSKDKVTTLSTTEITTSKSTTKPRHTPRPGPTTLGFSIPGDVLDTIFDLTTVQTPVSFVTPNPDADEDLDIDHRFNNGKDNRKDRHVPIIFPE